MRPAHACTITSEMRAAVSGAPLRTAPPAALVAAQRPLPPARPVRPPASPSGEPQCTRSLMGTGYYQDWSYRRQLNLETRCTLATVGSLGASAYIQASAGAGAAPDAR